MFFQKNVKKLKTHLGPGGSKLVDIVKAGSQKITLWGPQRTPLGILMVKKEIYPVRVLERPVGLQDFETSRITGQFST